MSETYTVEEAAKRLAYAERQVDMAAAALAAAWEAYDADPGPSTRNEVEYRVTLLTRRRDAEKAAQEAALVARYEAEG